MLTVDVVTLFPDVFEAHLKNLPFKKALKTNKLKINLHDLRDFAVDTRGSVDAKTYGGGVGMLLRIEPIYDALISILSGYKQKANNAVKVIVLTPKGTTYNQKMATYYEKLEHLAIICGRYEGIDARVTELGPILTKELGLTVTVDSISIGDFVLSGGELAALAILESVTRLIPGVIEKNEATKIESFTNENKKEYPQYTRPKNFKGLTVPQTLLSGNHKEIAKWRKTKTQP